MSEVLPYLEAQKDNVKEEDEKKDVEVPNIEGLTIEEAKKKLKKINLDLEIENEKDIVNTDIITRQIAPPLYFYLLFLLLDLIIFRHLHLYLYGYILFHTPLSHFGFLTLHMRSQFYMS